ncbi:hypothetical protein FJT64_027756 [Amphibalanus amphitrite]|uniref:Uncharacterized protein n=1 Tax=Amphibalanus amphitrite TaxID=1232801 RepID=A0A6A4VZA9_AMPAM|nr:hypothetical protein FJT64_027756 [Amphibalanus amphitrite]
MAHTGPEAPSAPPYEDVPTGPPPPYTAGGVDPRDYPSILERLQRDLVALQEKMDEMQLERAAGDHSAKQQELQRLRKEQEMNILQEQEELHRLRVQQEQERRDYELAVRLADESKTGGVEEVLLLPDTPGR